MSIQIDAKVETALREALATVARLEPGQVEPSLAGLSDSECAEAISLAVIITGYVGVDACGNQWPTQSSVRRIAEDLATTGKVARTFELDAELVYQYLSRAVFGSERLEDVLPDASQFIQFPIIVADQILGVYCPKEIEIWDYLDRIESAIEAAWALEPTVLAAAVLRSYMPPSKSGAKAPSA
jgi:hypothetical protein